MNNPIHPCVISFRIVLAPSELTRPVYEITNQCKSKVSECSKEFGILIEFIKIQNISHKCISKITGNCIYDVQCVFKILKPKIGDCYRACVKAIFKEGIFLDFHGVKILVPSEKEWTFEIGTGNIFYLPSKEKIQIGDWLNITLIMVQYENRKYQSIGKYI